MEVYKHLKIYPSTPMDTEVHVFMSAYVGVELEPFDEFPTEKLIQGIYELEAKYKKLNETPLIKAMAELNKEVAAAQDIS